MYKLYGQNKKKGWEEIAAKNSLEEINIAISNINSKEYYEYMVKESTKDGDNIIERKEFYEECEVEYSDNVKTKFEVKATIFKPGRAKEKEQLRKMTEEYMK